MKNNIIDNIKEKYPSLTRKQKQIMDCMLEDPESMVFMTLKELSVKASVSEVTILNACAALGYSNYNDIKYEFRKLVSDHNKALAQRDYSHSVPDRKSVA